MNPLGLIALGYLAYQVLAEIDRGIAVDLERLERRRLRQRRGLWLKAQWDAWFGVRRVIHEYMVRKNEAREHLLMCKRRDPRAYGQEIRELCELLKLLNAKLDRAYEEKERVEDILRVEDVVRWGRRSQEAAQRTRRRKTWIRVKNFGRRVIRG